MRKTARGISFSGRRPATGWISVQASMTSATALSRTAISRRSLGDFSSNSPRRSAKRSASLISVDLDDRRLAEVPTAEVAELLALVDIFMPSRQDVAAIFPGHTPLDALKALRELSPDTPVIAVKCGAQGAIAHQRNEADYLSSPSAARASNRRDGRRRRVLRRRAGRIFPRPGAGRSTGARRRLRVLRRRGGWTGRARRRLA